MSDSPRFEDIVLRLREQRQLLLASNLANADTPGYKAVDIDFAAALQEATQHVLPLAATKSRHLSAPARHSFASPMYRIPLQPALDGNTVETEREMALFAEAAIRTEFSVQQAMDDYLDIKKLFGNLK